jgi:CDGSH-type Zn-finger protein
MSDKTEVICINNGPLRIISESLSIKDAEGKEFGLGGRNIISLCRCGQSASKPFCDGSHARAGFQSVVEARDLPPKPQA